MDPESEGASEKTHLLKKDLPPQGTWVSTIKLVCVAGSGLFADGWDLGVTSFLIAILVHVDEENMTHTKESYVASMTRIGVIIGELGFGCIGDLLGRKWTSIITTLLTISGVVASGCVPAHGPLTLAASIGICRFFAGLGMGGEYPLSAAISKESAGNLRLTQYQLLQINSLLFLAGDAVQSLFSFILISAHVNVETTWRIVIIVGALPSVVGLCARMYFEETETPHPRGKRLSSYCESGVSAVCSKLLPILFVCSMIWMLSEYSSMGQTTYSHVVADELLGSHEDDIVRDLKRATIFGFIMACLRFVGVLGASFFLNRNVAIGRVQWMALLGSTVFTWLCCVSHKVHWLGTLFFFISVLMEGAISVTVYMMPALYFPKQVRSTAVGIAAAMGKVGAVIGTAAFPVINHHAGFVWTLFVSGAVILLASVVSISAPTAQIQE